MKLTSDSETLAENKVLILYILNKLKTPIDNDSLYKLVLSTQDINYFYFQQFLLDLLEDKYIECIKKDNKNVYKITSFGIETLALTLNILPGIIKLKIDMNFKNEISESNEKESIVAEFTPKNENEYMVSCKINECNECIFEVKTFAGSSEEAKRIVNNWKENAYSIYPEILNSLNKENK